MPKPPEITEFGHEREWRLKTEFGEICLGEYLLFLNSDEWPTESHKTICLDGDYDKLVGKAQNA